MSYFGATGTPVLDFWWRLLWVSKPEWFCFIHIAEVNVMYISWDPPLVLHVADLLTDSIAGRQPGSYLAPHVHIQRRGLEMGVMVGVIGRRGFSGTFRGSFSP